MTHENMHIAIYVGRLQCWSRLDHTSPVTCVPRARPTGGRAALLWKWLSLLLDGHSRSTGR